MISPEFDLSDLIRKRFPRHDVEERVTLSNVLQLQDYSVRNACMGSTLEARAAGSHAAIRAMAVRISGADTNTAGSQGLTPKRRVGKRRVNPKDAATVPSDFSMGSRRLLQPESEAARHRVRRAFAERSRLCRGAPSRPA